MEQSIALFCAQYTLTDQKRLINYEVNPII